MRVFKDKSASASLHRRTLMLCGAVMLGIAAGANVAKADALTIGGVTQEEYKGALGKVSASENPLKYQDAVYSQEQVTTPPWGTTSLQFLDGTKLEVGQASDVTLDEFVYDPNQTLTSAAIKFNRGVFRFITGENTRKEGVSLTTPVATLSIRGTDLLIKVDYDGTTTVSVLKGAIAALACDRPEQIVSAGRVLKIPNNCAEKTTVGPYTPAAPGGPDTSPGAGNTDKHHESRSGN
ncbi:FecR family protein [Hypericibacter sp.]|uniref:FecR family protein n=1 Tax=Hypericibacter sp. TaxID=2705401 RepID=UPI003D6D781E